MALRVIFDQRLGGARRHHEVAPGGQFRLGPLVLPQRKS